VKLIYAVILASISLTGCSNAQLARESSQLANSAFSITPASEVTWEKLNPARGDKSPQAATLWGDRKGEEATGFLAKFVDGFSSPPHIHNVSYRAVVISGLIHNDDPEAEKMWMPAGAFWTQPKGEAHITAAKGDHNVALVEINEGPYLVRPPGEQFDSGERPINIDPSNMVWTSPSGLPHSSSSPQIAYLWGKLGEGEANGTFLKLPAGFAGSIHSTASVFRAVLVGGDLHHDKYNGESLLPGSYITSSGDFMHHISTKNGCTVYIRTLGRYKATQGQE